MSDEMRDEARRRERERRQAGERRRRFATDVQAVARTPEGRRLLAWILGRGGLFAGDCPGDPTAAAFAAGRRTAAVELWNVLQRNLSREAFAGIALAGAGWPEDRGDAEAESSDEEGRE